MASSSPVAVACVFVQMMRILYAVRTKQRRIPLSLPSIRDDAASQVVVYKVYLAQQRVFVNTQLYRAIESSVA